jgi:hypothetical protein
VDYAAGTRIAMVASGSGRWTAAPHIIRKKFDGLFR